MLKNTLIAATFIAAPLLVATPSFAGTQDDIKDCKAAMTEQGKVNLDETRLSFDKSKGNSRKRTLSFTAKSKADGTKSTVQCVMERSAVVEIAVAQ